MEITCQSFHRSASPMATRSQEMSCKRNLLNIWATYWESQRFSVCFTSDSSCAPITTLTSRSTMLQAKATAPAIISWSPRALPTLTTWTSPSQNTPQSLESRKISAPWWSTQCCLPFTKIWVATKILRSVAMIPTHRVEVRFSLVICNRLTITRSSRMMMTILSLLETEIHHNITS